MGKQNNKKKKGGKKAKKQKQPLSRHDANVSRDGVDSPSTETNSNHIDALVKALNLRKEQAQSGDSHLTKGAIASIMLHCPMREDIVLRPTDPPIFLQILTPPPVCIKTDVYMGDVSDGEFFVHFSLRSSAELLAYSTLQIQSFIVDHLNGWPVLVIHDVIVVDGYEKVRIGHPVPFHDLPYNAVDGSSDSMADEKSSKPAKEVRVGKRVWFRLDESELSWKCGVVKAVDESGCTVLPMTSKDQDDLYEVVPVELVRVMGDSMLSTLRFQKGDMVLTLNRGAWLPTIVVNTWPTQRNADAKIPSYSCRPLAAEDMRDRYEYTVYADTDDHVRPFPLSNRFSIGDKVVFATGRDLAEGLESKSQKSWIEGKITEAFVINSRGYVGEYRCTPVKGKKKTTYLLPQDKDEYVASVASSPRERLLEAIEQDCSYEHIDYIVKTFDLDVVPFRDLLVSKAIESASYEALSWLQNNAMVNLYRIRDSNGNGLLHQIAKSPHVERFIIATSERMKKSPLKSRIELFNECGDSDDNLIGQRNSQGRLWLHELIIAGNSRALELVLSPSEGLAWLHFMWLKNSDSCGANDADVVHVVTKDNKGLSLRDTAHLLGRFNMEKMIDKFSEWFLLFLVDRHIVKKCDDMYIDGDYSDETMSEEIPSDEALEMFGNEKTSSVALRLIQFYRDFGRHPSYGMYANTIESTCISLAEIGYLRALTWLINEDLSLLNSGSKVPIETSEDRHEFAQPELWDFAEVDETKEYMSLTSIAAHGPFISRNDALDSETRHEYWAMLASFSEENGESRRCCKTAFIDYVKMVRQSDDIASDDLCWLLGYKLDILQDNNLLEARLKVLDYLVKEKAQQPPKALDVIRWRQCGVLRWLVEGSFIDLKGDARLESTIIKEDMKFMGGFKIPKSMSVAVFLCFAAIEFDDLESLQWLVDDKGVDLSEIRCGGWNVLHCCAYFGRTEIFLWLRSLEDTRSFLAEPCAREPYSGVFAAHMAVKRGYIFLADLLLGFGCPLQDCNGESIQCSAEKSEFEFVRKWGKSQEKPILLERDVEKLLQLLSSGPLCVDAVKAHISNSGCMDSKRWTECDYKVHTAGPLGKSYLDVLDECCKVNNPDFIVWLCKEVTPSLYTAAATDDTNGWNCFWGFRHSLTTRRNVSKALDYHAVAKHAAETNDSLLSELLNDSTVTEVICTNPLQKNHVLRKMLRCSKANTSLLVSLNTLSAEYLSLEALNELRIAQMNTLKRQVLQDSSLSEMECAIKKVMITTSALAKRDGQPFETYFSGDYIILPNGALNLDCRLTNCGYGDNHPLGGMIEWESRLKEISTCLYVVLVVEGFAELLSWCTGPQAAGRWNADKEFDAVRMAAYLGHTDIVHMFVQRQSTQKYPMSVSDSLRPAILGAVEAGDIANLSSYIDECDCMVLRPDPLLSGFEKVQCLDSFSFRHKNGRLKRRNQVCSSVVATAVYACLHSSNQTQEDDGDARNSGVCRSLVEFMVHRMQIDASLLARAAAVIAVDLECLSDYERCTDLLKVLVYDFSLDVWTCQEELNQLCEVFSNCLLDNGKLRKDGVEKVKAIAIEWFVFALDIGFDFQWVRPSFYRFEPPEIKSLGDAIEKLQMEQLKSWSQFDLVKQWTLEEIQQAEKDGTFHLQLRYKQGLLSTHLAAAYDRLDVLKWFVREKGMSLESCDGLGRTVSEVALASNARNTHEWIEREKAMQVISVFATTRFRGRSAIKHKLRMLRALVYIQAWLRGNIVREKYRGLVLSRLEATKRFEAIWGGSVDGIARISSLRHQQTWMALKKEKHDVVLSDDVVGGIEEIAETSQKLDKAMIQAVRKEDITEQCGEIVDSSQESGDSSADSRSAGSHLQQPGRVVKRIKLTGGVVKWLRQGDSKYRDFFVRRINQLAAGERSRILAKRLTGCKTLIFETYLEQKSGFRILWTENTDGSLLIWYVAKHKSVSRLICLIDDAESRSKRQLEHSWNLPDFNHDCSGEAESAIEERIMLDPLGDTPLKLYEVGVDEVQKLSDEKWKPRLYLTSREREIVETSGTVLLLGRSGTGKTSVICNRMEYDRRLAGNDFTFSQLFVSRSHRLRDYVREVVDVSGDPDEGDEHSSLEFETFGQVVRILEDKLPVTDGNTNQFLPSQRMDFGRFKREIHRPESSSGLDALVVWTNIRSFIKGGIEALLNPRHVLAESEYLELGKRRCRLSPDQRRYVYASYERYFSYMKEHRLWDDCDRITSLVQRMEHARTADPESFQQVRYSKIYVDEVQDYTQAEIALFFYLCGPGDLFLAGDPAQSVVEGVEFRFEEIRSVGYHLYGEDRRHLIPDKPKTVHLNFRSHSGILNVAAAVLSCLFRVFPDSAKQLKEDRGLFQGPRPGVCHKVDPTRLSRLVEKRNGIVVLTHDHKVTRLRRFLHDYPLIYGIREAKGLEFREVILVDFFVDMPTSLQKLWRDLLLGRDASEVCQRPEIEGQLKLLYTAITRCIQRLFFAETKSSTAGDAFVRWLTGTTNGGGKDALAVKNRVDDIESMVRTPDEWRSAGMDNAIMAESSDDLLEAEKWLDRAIYCFEQVNDEQFARKARTHRSGIRFQAALVDRAADDATGTDNDIIQTEVDAALLTEKLLAEELFVEARKVCRSILPFLDTDCQEMLQRQLISKLPSVDNEF